MEVDLSNMTGVALILARPTGVLYANQTCGHACEQSTTVGTFVPFNDEELMTEGRLRDVTLDVHHLTPELADRIDEILESSHITRYLLASIAQSSTSPAKLGST